MNELIDNREIIASYNSGMYNQENFDDIDPKFIPILPLNKDPFMSTISFVEILTKISHLLLETSQKSEFLKEELKKLNFLLPAGVYVPFNMFQARQCAVLHIPISEARVFTTKERAPYKICIEIFRPYKEIKKSCKGPKIEKSKESRSVSVPVNITRNESIPRIDPYFARSLKEENEYLHDSSITRRRNLTFAFTNETDVIHYEKVFTNAEAGSLAVVYGEIDEVGNNVSVFKESFKEQKKRIQKASPYGKLIT